jgi:trigger factor
VDQNELTYFITDQAQRMGVPAEYLAKQLVESGQVNSAVQEVRRGKAAATIAERVKVTDEDGTAIDVKAQVEALVAAQTADLQAEAAAEEAEAEELEAEELEAGLEADDAASQDDSDGDDSDGDEPDGDEDGE